MIEHRRSLEDGEKGRGSVNTVLRRKDEIIRPMGKWSPAVHGLLQYLNKKGFSYSPLFLGVDDAGKERLSYIDGGVAMRPWPKCLLANHGLEQIGKMLRSYHEIALEYKPPKDAVWRDPTAAWSDGMIIRHGDLGPWNMVWKSERLVGLIDWDLALPGMPIDDLAQVAWYCVPLRARKGCDDSGVDMRLIGERLKCFCAAYGVNPDFVIEALISLEQLEINQTIRLAKLDIQPWVDFQNRGDVDDIEQDLQWLLQITEGAQQGARVDALTRATQL